MAVTLKDVAREASVSNVTVSRVLAGKQSAIAISEPTRQRVLQAAARLGYQPNLLARGLRTQRSGAIGVMVEDITDPFFAALIPEVDLVFKERGYRFLLSHAALDPRTGPTYDRLLGASVDGLLVLGDRALNREAEEGVLAHQRFVVGIARARHGSAIPSVNVDDDAGVRLALDHLRALGHRRIGFVGNRAVWDMERRLDVFLSLMAQVGLDVPADAVALTPHTAAGGYAAARRLLEGQSALTALLCTTDLLALGALCALNQGGLQAPRDLSVVGFDDIPLAAYATPPLTTVRQPVAALARTAATLLLDVIEGGTSGHVNGATPAEPLSQNMPPLLAPELVARASSGPRRGEMASRVMG